MCLHYLINRLQPLPWTHAGGGVAEPGPRASRRTRSSASYDYSHPVFDAAAIDAQRRLPQIQGRANTWFCGAWTRYGFHEDGLMSGLAVAAALRERLRRDQPVREAA